MLYYRTDATISATDKTCAASTHKKRKKDASVVAAKDSNAVLANKNCTDTQSTGSESIKKKKNKKKKNKNSGKMLPTISDDRLKAYGINPKKFKYFHQKKLLEKQK